MPEGFEAVFLEIGNLPFYNEDLEVEGKVPTEWTTFRNELQSVDGVFFFTPEYNRSVPAALKNALMSVHVLMEQAAGAGNLL